MASPAFWIVPDSSGDRTPALIRDTDDFWARPVFQTLAGSALIESTCSPNEDHRQSNIEAGDGRCQAAGKRSPKPKDLLEPDRVQHGPPRAKNRVGGSHYRRLYQSNAIVVQSHSHTAGMGMSIPMPTTFDRNRLPCLKASG